MRPETVGDSGELEPGVVEKMSPKNNCGRTSIARRVYISRFARSFAAMAVLAICSVAFYRVRELLAALLLFSVFFAVAIVGVLILWLIEEAAHKASVELESHLVHPSTPLLHPQTPHAAVPAPSPAKHASRGRWWN